MAKAWRFPLAALEAVVEVGEWVSVTFEPDRLGLVMVVSIDPARWSAEALGAALEPHGFEKHFRDPGTWTLRALARTSSPRSTSVET